MPRSTVLVQFEDAHQHQAAQERQEEATEFIPAQEMKNGGDSADKNGDSSDGCDHDLNISWLYEARRGSQVKK